MKKEPLRTEILSRRSSLEASFVVEKSRLICSHLIEYVSLFPHQNIALYAPFRNEVDLFSLLDMPGRRFFFPRVRKGTKALDFHRVSSRNELVPGFQNIPEPEESSLPVALSDIDLFLVPGVAFSLRGERIGYGGGYYDETLRHRRSGVPALGVGFMIQVIKDGFSDPWDTPLDGIVTETGISWSSQP